jgi:DNA transposition AAA+ family ATPase
MKKIKTYKQFFEDGTACVNASTAGMGAVVSATVGSLPGVAGSSGSGDVSSFLGVSTKQPVGGPSEVSDLRYLEEEDDIEEIDDLKKKKKNEKNIK